MPPTALRRRVAPRTAIRVRGGARERHRDRLAGEEPMEIRVEAPGRAPEPIAVTMRTPGDDFELAAGFLLTEGVIGPGDVAGVGYCREAGEDQRYNVVTVRAAAAVASADARRATFTSSSCGICGKASLESIVVRSAPLGAGPSLPASAMFAMPGAMRAAQSAFDATGGLHAAGLFRPDGALEVLREDVGRHNAVDKAIGHALLAGRLPLHDRVLLVSGRASFELVQKAAVAGIPVLLAVSAPSSLAADAADRLGLTLAGFLRGDGVNIYTHPERIDLDA